MGFLEAGTPLTWTDSLEFVKYVREHGIQQFINTYNRIKDRTNDVLKWGDEIEYHLVELRQHGDGRVETRLALIGPEVLAQLEREDAEAAAKAAGGPTDGAAAPSAAAAAQARALSGAWHPEYGSWMVEATPGHPYGGDTSCLRQVEANMAYRRARITAAAGRVAAAQLAAALGASGSGAPTTSSPSLRVVPFSTVAYPLMGVGREFTSPPAPPGGPFSASAYLPDSVISPHPRFGTLTANIRHRRGRKVEIQVPLFADERTSLAAVTTLGWDAKPDGTAGSGGAGGDGSSGKRSASAARPGGAAGATGPCGCGPSPLSRQLHVAAGGARSSAAAPQPGGGSPNDDPAAAASQQLSSDAAFAAYDGRDTTASLRLKSVLRSRGSAMDLTTAAAVGASAGSAPSSPSAGSSLGSGSGSVHGAAEGAGARSSSGGIGGPRGPTVDVAAAAGDGALLPRPSSPATPGSSLSAYDAVGPATVPSPGCIHMDAMGFGMGCCCLQVTFQARDLAESRRLYDQLTVVAPLMMALTANSAIWRGRLADTDTRWDVISASVDCRTPAERGDDGSAGSGSGGGPLGDAVAATAADPAAAPPAPALPTWMRHPAAGNAAGGGRVRLSKSRYSSVDCYIDNRPGVCVAAGAGFVDAADAATNGLNRYNDVPVPVDPEAVATLRGAGVDAALAHHIAHLFVRDPLVIFRDRTTGVDDARSTEHFENVQSTNWQSVRWKPPPPDAAGIGWRVELRTMEAQCTDFENAAFTVFVVLLTRVMLFFDLNLYVPMSAVEANFETAGARGAAVGGRFFFRRHVWASRCDDGSGSASAASAAANGGCCADCGRPCPPAAGGTAADQEDAFDRLSLAEIFLGPAAAAARCCGGDGDAAPAPACCSCQFAFPGLIPLIYAYLDIIECDAATRGAVDAYLRLVAGRATGEVMTGAAWQRAFVTSHPCYAGDSVVGPVIVHDLLATIAALAGGSPAGSSGSGVSAGGAQQHYHVDPAVRTAASALLGPLAPPPITFPDAHQPPPPHVHGEDDAAVMTPVPEAAGAAEEEEEDEEEEGAARRSVGAGSPARTSPPQSARRESRAASDAATALLPLQFTGGSPAHAHHAHLATGFLTPQHHAAPGGGALTAAGTTAPGAAAAASARDAAAVAAGAHDGSSVPLAAYPDQLPPSSASRLLPPRLASASSNNPYATHRAGSLGGRAASLSSGGGGGDGGAIPPPPPPVRLRGASFAEELKPHTCRSLLLRTLATQYAGAAASAAAGRVAPLSDRDGAVTPPPPAQR